MFPGFHGGGEMHRPEGGRRGHQHVFAIGGEDLLIVVVAVITLVRRDVEFFPGSVRLVFERIAHGHHFHFDAEDLAGLGEILERAVAASAAADEGDFDFLDGSRRVDRENLAGGEAGSDKCRISKEGAAVHGVLNFRIGK